MISVPCLVRKHHHGGRASLCIILVQSSSAEGRAMRAAKHPSMHRTSSTTRRLLPPQMSIVPRWRTLPLEALLYIWGPRFLSFDVAPTVISLSVLIFEGTTPFEELSLSPAIEMNCVNGLSLSCPQFGARYWLSQLPLLCNTVLANEM